MHCRQAVFAAATALYLALAAPAVAWPTSNMWVPARATYYGRDAWPVHNGACGFGFICPGRWTPPLAQGYDVVAVSDKSALFTGSQCGQCLELRCRDGTFTDGFGDSYTRIGLCKSGAETLTVKVKITDECPCVYPGNAVSNKRWCCGDMEHLDVSEWALEKITLDTTRWGVFAIEYRQVDCDDAVQDEAPNLNPVPADPHYNMKPAGMNCDTVAQSYASAATRQGIITAKRRATAAKNSSYWSKWWDQVQNWSFARKTALYKDIWKRIRAGKLDASGHRIRG